MNRRNFLRTGTLAAGLALPALARATAASATPAAGAAFAPTPETGWRRFELTTRIEPLAADGATRVWVPLPAMNEADWQRPMGSLWQGNADYMTLVRDASGTEMLYAEWAPGSAVPQLEVVSRFATRDRAVDFSHPHAEPLRLPPAQHAHYTRATALLPTDGIVGDTARDIVRGAKTDEDKARAIYDWIVDNTFRDPKVRGCGTGDIRTMLETGDLAGKCADLNALFVGLARAAGLPARDVYGLRVADSRFGYKSLGKSGNVSKGQHCRAEVFLERFGWVPVDPADVRKVVLEEPPGQLSIVDPKVIVVRKRLFGAWEMNWLAYNDAHDLKLPHSTGDEVPFLMYPQGEANGERFDSLDPDAFRYTLTATELG
ncbi:transglutaminase domain-containing protein [Thauera sp. JM12B12]|uniref:transglutaminase-like domain-containing protein n=1 Tax=Thauera sp. JM12B12 TaxID=3142262 RepID=UPI0031F40E47